MSTITTGPLAMDWSLYAGDANRMDFNIVANDPVDLTGAEVEAQIRTTAPASVVALTATVVIVEATLGRFTVEWDGEEARDLLGANESWKGVWDLQVTFAGETLPRTLLRGVATITHDVTRAGA